MKTLVLLLLGLVAVSAPAQTTVDFNSSGHLALNFVTPVESNLFSQSATGGLSGSGAVAVPTVADNQFWGFNQGFAGNTDHTVSVYLHTAEVLNTGYITFGLMANAEQSGVLYPSGGDYLAVSVDPASGNFELKGEGAFNVSGSTFDTLMAADSWYYLELAYDWQFNEFYGLRFRAFASDASGNIGASLIDSTSYNSGLESSLAVDAEVFSFFGGNNSGNAIAYLDNFQTSGLSAVVVTAIPEPGSYALILGVVALGLVWRRRVTR